MLKNYLLLFIFRNLVEGVCPWPWMPTSFPSWGNSFGIPTEIGNFTLGICFPLMEFWQTGAKKNKPWDHAFKLGKENNIFSCSMNSHVWGNFMILWLSKSLRQNKGKGVGCKTFVWKSDSFVATTFFIDLFNWLFRVLCNLELTFICKF